MAKKRKRKSGLFGFDLMKDTKKTIGRKEIGYAMFSAIGGSFLGAVIGKPAGIAGIVVAGGGTAMSNLYVASLGAGMLLGAKAQGSGLNGADDDDMQGFSVDEMKERAQNYFKEMGAKLYLPVSATAPATPAPAATNGLNGNEEVNYFLNPYTSGNLNMDELDKVHSKVAQMNGTGVGDFDESENY